MRVRLAGTSVLMGAQNVVMASSVRLGRARLQLCCSSGAVCWSQDLSFPGLIPLLVFFPCCQLPLKGLGWPSLDPVDFNGKNCDPCSVV